MEEYAWVTAVNLRFQQMEADRRRKESDECSNKLNARIESSLHGAENSIREIHPCSSFVLPESNQQFYLRMEENHREIQRSFARIIALLDEMAEEEELESNGSSVVKDESSLSDASESSIVDLQTPVDGFHSSEQNFTTLVSDKDSVVHDISPSQEAPLTHFSVEVIATQATDRGLSLKFVMPFDLDIASLLISQARIRQHRYSDAFFDERKIVLVSVYGNLKVDITGIQQYSRFVPPDYLVICCASENLGKDVFIPTTCLKKCMYEMFKHSSSSVHCTAYIAEQQEDSLSKISYSTHLVFLKNDRFTLALYEIGTIAMVEHITPKLGIKLNYIDNVIGVNKGKQRYNAASLVASRFLSLTGGIHDRASDFHIRNGIDEYNFTVVVSKINLPHQLVLKLDENCVCACNRYLRMGEKVNQVQVHVNPCVGEQIGFINGCSINCDLLDNVQESDIPPYEKNKEFNDKLIYSHSVQSTEVRMHYLKFVFEGFKCPIVVFQEMSLRMSKALQKIDHYTLLSILNGCIVLSAYMRYVHCGIIETKFESSKFVCNTIATMEAKCDYLNAINAMFVSMQVWDTSTWPPLVVYAHHGKAVGSFRFYVVEVFKYRWSTCQWQPTKVQKDARTTFTWLGRVLLERDILIASTVVNVTQPAVVGEEENVAGWLPFTLSSKRDMIDIDSCKVCQIALDKPGGKSVLLRLLGLLVQATIDGVAMYFTNEWVLHASLYDSDGRDTLEFIYATLRDSFVCSVNMLYLVMAPYSIKAIVNWDLLESFRLSKCFQNQLNQRIIVLPKWPRRKSKDVFDCICQDEPCLEDKLPNICTAAMGILTLWFDCVQLLLAIPWACLASHYVLLKIVERQSILNADTTCKLTMFQHDPISWRLVACNIRLQSAYGLDVDMYTCKSEEMQQAMSATNMQVGESSNLFPRYLCNDDHGTKQIAEIISANYSLVTIQAMGSGWLFSWA